MKTLFIAGNENSGKTTTFNNLFKKIQKEYQDKYEVILKELNELPYSHLNPHDYIIILKEKKTKSKRQIFLNFSADNNGIINKFIDYLKDCITDAGLENVILITTARNTGDNKRKILEDALHEIYPNYKNDSNFRELPLAHIHENCDKSVKDWYFKSVDKILEHILAMEPFNLF